MKKANTTIWSILLSVGVVLIWGILITYARFEYDVPYSYLLTASIVLSLAGIIYGFVIFKKKNLIESIPTSKIRSLAMGLVEIKGQVMNITKKLISPLYGKNCYYYNYQIQEEVRGKNNTRSWRTVKSGKNYANFYLKDDTAKVLVDPRGADITCKKISSTMYRNSIKPLLLKSFKNINYNPSFFTSNKLRLIEHVLEPETNLYILGTAGDNPFVKEATAVKHYEDIMIKKGKIVRDYYISNEKEGSIIKNLEMIFKTTLISGFTIFMISMYFLFV